MAFNFHFDPVDLPPECIIVLERLHLGWPDRS